MNNCKSTYLVKAANTSNAPLVEVTGKQWYEIVKANKNLPKSSQRYFITDQIVDGDSVDRMIIEVSEHEYKQWRTAQQQKRRNIKQAEGVKVLSLDDLTADGITLLETLHDEHDGFDACTTDILLQELRHALSLWNCWGDELLTMYLNSDQRASTAWLASKCGISEKQARIYRKHFEAFIKKFLG